MSDPIEPPVNPATPWEFLADDEQEWEPEPAAEEAAMHVISPGDEGAEPGQEEVAVPANEDVAHYLDDERPEIVDTATMPPSETTSPVGRLLERQHYLAPGQQDEISSPDDTI